MGVLSTTMNRGPTTVCSKRKTQKESQKSRVTYTMLSRLVCRDTFCFLTGVKDKRLRNLIKHYKSEGLCQRRKKSGGRKSNTKALTLDDTNRVYKFIKNYAEDNAVSLPGRVPGFKRDDILLLPSSAPKSQVHRLFLQSCEAAGARSVALSTFRKLWRSLLPFVVVARPMTDLCWICQNNNNRIFYSGNMTDQEKDELLVEQRLHLSRVEEERVLYRTMTADCKAVVGQLGINNLSRNPVCSRDITAHYSFDYAQQVHLPHSPAQPGPLYFMTPRKCGIFGVCCEGLPQQVNYLIDEGASSSKGSNAVISYLHHFFDQYGLGEKNADLHCDNCSGQNKNRYILWYFCWRVMTGQHQSITLNFMPPGHTKFAPDWCFGLLKRKFRQSEVHCLEDFCDVVRQSTPVQNVNIAQVVGKENGEVMVNSYDWQEFFTPHFKPLVGMKKLGHFRFSSEFPGIVFYKETLADQETPFLMVKNLNTIRNDLEEIPQVVPPPGLSQERQEYLFRNIRQFVRDAAKDTVTPDPRL